MSLRSWRFAAVTLATAFTMGVTAALGLWQLGRAAQKQSLQDQLTERGQLPAWTERDLLQAGEPQVGLHRPVRLSGHWVAGASVFLDNRQMDGRVGFFLVTPLRIAGSERVLLVQRGWVPRDFSDRSRLPAIDTPGGAVLVEGRLAPVPDKLFELGESEPGLIRQNVDVAAFAQETGLPLMNVSVLQTGAAADGLKRDWPQVGTGVHKHHGYAFQWFALCILAGILYVWFQFISPLRKCKPHDPED